MLLSHLKLFYSWFLQHAPCHGEQEFFKHHRQVIHTRLITGFRDWWAMQSEAWTTEWKRKTEILCHLSNDFLTILLGGRLPETENKRMSHFWPKSGRPTWKLSNGCVQESFWNSIWLKNKMVVYKVVAYGIGGGHLWWGVVARRELTVAGYLHANGFFLAVAVYKTDGIYHWNRVSKLILPNLKFCYWYMV